MIKIAPSILAADFANMGAAVKSLEQWNADWVHFDVMDGHFVPNITFGPPMCAAVRALTKLPLDVHLMVERPADWVEPFVKAGADIITVHAEADVHIVRTLQHIRACGKLAGVVLNPGTPVSAAHEMLPFCDLVLLMSVNPGFGGQSFIPGTVRKIAELKALIRQMGLTTRIEVDGGINAETALPCIEAGADILVAGSAVFGAADPKETIRSLRHGR